jgi:hypothetical protein
MFKHSSSSSLSFPVAVHLGFGIVLFMIHGGNDNDRVRVCGSRHRMNKSTFERVSEYYQHPIDFPCLSRTAAREWLAGAPSAEARFRLRLRRPKGLGVQTDMATVSPS